jgi:hypothetical protein
MDRRLSAKVRFEELPIEDKFKSVFEEYKRKVQEEVLFNVLTQFYFADWTRACDYEKMTPEEVVEAAMTVCKKLEEQYNYSLDDDIF